MLTASQLLRWRNTSQRPLSELRFHLYLNGFRNSQSTFMQGFSSRRRPTGDDVSAWGYIDIQSLLRLAEPTSGNQATLANAAQFSGVDLTPRISYIHPDIPEHTEDKSVISVALNSPLRPGESIALYFDFQARLPQPPIERTGAKQEYFFVGQWFPKIGVLEDGVWKCHQFHANSEFFADFGVYDVAITVPTENLVGATGLQTDIRQNEDGTATHYYHAEDVHDFAWTSSPEFREYRGKAQDVDIRVLIQPDREDLAARHVEAAKVAVQYYQDWYGDYPYPNLTIVDPRRGAAATGGMEYPTLITVGTRYGSPDGLLRLEQTIIHEIGHNYFYHLLASNEAEEPWLDEGITSYTETRIMNAEYGPRGDMINMLGLEINGIDLQRTAYLFFPDLDATQKKSWEYYSGTSFGINAYARPVVLLTTLENYLGGETMLRIMRTYVERCRFRHPDSKDFFVVANEVSGQDLTWFFDQAIYTNRIVDYQVSSIYSRPAPEKHGYDIDFETDGSPIDRESQPDTDPVYDSGVDIRRLGDFIFPVELQVVFANGDTLLEHWDGKDLWKKFRYQRDSKLVSATIDPYDKVLLDVNMTNNSKVMAPSAQGITRLSARWMFWSQFLFDQPEFLNLISLIGR